MNEAARVKLGRGSLYLSREIHDRYFPGLETVILLRRQDDLLILPVRNAAAGGYLLKLRNGAGDRVVNAPDFFREQEIADGAQLDLAATWVGSSAALVVHGAFTMQS